MNVIFYIAVTILAIFLGVFFGNLYRKDRDKRKLMFMLAFAFASLSFLPKMQNGLENTLIMQKLLSWSSLPMLSAVLIAVISSLLKIEDFDKPFKAFLFAAFASIIMIVVPFEVKSFHPLLYQGASMIVIVTSIYLVSARRKVFDLMFLFSMVCYISGGLGMTRELGVEFIVFTYIFAYVFIALVFVTSREKVTGSVASFFALKRELHETQEELRVSQEKLMKAEKLAAIGQAATMVGHDLRNPLQAIRNAAYYLNGELSHHAIPQKTVEMLQIIDDSVDYADKIVRDLKHFASTRQPLLRKTNVNTIVLDALSQVAVPENVEVVTELGHIPEIGVDKDMMKRVFLKLLVNGIQAMENGGMLKVSTQETRDFVRVSFEDTGIGIPKENVKKLFSPFFTTKAQGMGMGLAICKKIVDMHRGNIKIESEVDKGSNFTVKLPIKNIVSPDTKVRRVPTEHLHIH